MIAKLLAAGMLPGVWISDEATRVLRRQIARRSRRAYGFHSAGALIALAMLSLARLCPHLPR